MKNECKVKEFKMLLWNIDPEVIKYSEKQWKKRKEDVKFEPFGTKDEEEEKGVRPKVVEEKKERKEQPNYYDKHSSKTKRTIRRGTREA